MKGIIRKLMFIVGENRAYFIWIAIIGFILEILISIINPLVIKLLIDKGIMGKNMPFFIIFGICSIAFFTFYRLGLLWYRLAFRRLKNKIIKETTLKQLNAYFKFPYEKIIKNDTGYYISRIYDESSAGVELTLSKFSELLISIASFIGAFGIAIYLSWRVTVILLIIIPPIYLLSQKFSSRITEKSKREKQEEAKVRNLFGRIIDAYKNIKIFNLFVITDKRINEYFDKYLAVFYSRFRISNLFSTYSGILLSYQELIILLVAGYEVMRGRMTIGGLMGYMNAFSMVVGYALSIVRTIPALSKIEGDIGRLMDFRDVGNRENNLLRKNYNRINLYNVNFAYGSDKNIFKKLNFEARKGEKVLVTGDNGSGKSTFIHILLNLLHPLKGKAESYPIERISALTLPFYFIPGTLKENVNYENLSTERKELFKKLIKDFGLNGYEEKDPSSLSTGEKQKCAIIMTLMKDADLYIFDEPTANVDQKSKDIIMDRIFKYTEGKALIVVLHGEEKYYDKFDRIFNLEKEAA